MEKTLVIFNDGTFGWSEEGGFYDVLYSDKNSIASPFFKNLYYEDGDGYIYISTMQQFIWLMVLFNSIGIIIVNQKEKLIIILSLIGIIIFNLMFEARARYIILYVPFFIMATMLSLQNLEIYLKKKYSR